MPPHVVGTFTPAEPERLRPVAERPPQSPWDCENAIHVCECGAPALESWIGVWKDGDTAQRLVCTANPDHGQPDTAEPFGINAMWDDLIDEADLSWAERRRLNGRVR